MTEQYHENAKSDVLDDVIELTSDKGEVFKFYHIGTIEYKDDWFVFFQRAEQLEGVDPDELVIFKLSGDEGNEVLLPIEDETLLDEVYEEFMRELEEDDGCTGDCAGCSGCGSNNEE